MECITTWPQKFVFQIKKQTSDFSTLLFFKTIFLCHILPNYLEMGYREFSEKDSIYQLTFGASVFASGMQSSVEYGKIQPVEEMDS